MKIYYSIYIALFLILFSCTAEKPETLEQTSKFREYIYESIDKTSFIQTESFDLSKDITVRIIFNHERETMDVTIYDSTNQDKNIIQYFNNLESESGCNNPKLIDFNSDGVLDLLVDYGTGARGANQFYYLFIKNAVSNEFELIEESAEIPNLSFNTERQMIEGTYFYSGTSFIDFQLKNRKLIKFTGVDSWSSKECTFHKSYDFDSNENQINIKIDSVIDNLKSLYSRKY